MQHEGRAASLLEEAARAAGWSFDGRHVVVQPRPGRRQRVLGEILGDGGGEFLRLCSAIGDAAVMNEARLAAALRMNARLCAGAIAIDGDVVVVVEVLPLALARADTVRDAVARLAAKADEFEQGLFGVDAR